MECTDGTCNMENVQSCACGSEKPYEQCCGCEPADPTQISMKSWHNSFFAALNQAQVDRLRKKIESSFGPTLDKEADAVIEAVGKVWSSMITLSDAKKELAAKLQKIHSESNKR